MLRLLTVSIAALTALPLAAQQATTVAVHWNATALGQGCLSGWANTTLLAEERKQEVRQAKFFADHDQLKFWLFEACPRDANLKPDLAPPHRLEIRFAQSGTGVHADLLIVSPAKTWTVPLDSPLVSHDSVLTLLGSGTEPLWNRIVESVELQFRKPKDAQDPSKGSFVQNVLHSPLCKYVRVADKLIAEGADFCVPVDYDRVRLLSKSPLKLIVAPGQPPLDGQSAGPFVKQPVMIGAAQVRHLKLVPPSADVKPQYAKVIEVRVVKILESGDDEVP